MAAHRRRKCSRYGSALRGTRYGAKGTEERAGAHRGSGSGRDGVQGVGIVVRRRCTADLAEEVVVGLLPASGSHGRLQRRATNPGGRSARPEDHRQCEIAVAAELTCGEISGKFPTQAGVWIEAACSGRSLGTRRSCGATRGRLRCGGAAWPRRRTGLFVVELCERGGQGFGAAL